MVRSVWFSGVGEMANKSEWIVVHFDNECECTDKLKVEGGWLYRVEIWDATNQIWDATNQSVLALTFVPDAEKVPDA